MHARKGPQQVIVATTHKIARIVHHLLKPGEAYVEQRAASLRNSAGNASCASWPIASANSA